MNRRQQIKKNLKRAKSAKYATGFEHQAIGNAVGGAKPAQFDVGAQLRGRVKSGAISSDQAQQTARERQTLEAAYGKNWRNRVYGQGGAQGISGPFARGTIAADRSSALEQARNMLDPKNALVSERARVPGRGAGGITPFGIQAATKREKRRRYL